MEIQMAKKSKDNLEEEKASWKMYASRIKRYYKSIVLRTVWYSCLYSILF